MSQRSILERATWRHERHLEWQSTHQKATAEEKYRQWQELVLKEKTSLFSEDDIKEITDLAARMEDQPQGKIVKMK